MSKITVVSSAFRFENNKCNVFKISTQSYSLHAKTTILNAYLMPRVVRTHAIHQRAPNNRKSTNEITDRIIARIVASTPSTQNFKLQERSTPSDVETPSSRQVTDRYTMGEIAHVITACYRRGVSNLVVASRVNYPQLRTGATQSTTPTDARARARC